MATRKIDAEQEKEAVSMYLAGSSVKSIAAHFSVHAATMRMAFARNGIQPRTRLGGGARRFTPAPELLQLLVCSYKAGASLAVLSAQFGKSPAVISRALELAGVELRYGLSGALHPRWKGGRVAHTSSKYVLARVGADDPLYCMTHNGYAFEHRIVMARLLGRVLRRNETVHHIDGNRSNNAAANLQLRQGAHGVGAAFCCLDCGSCNIGPVPIAEHEVAA